MTKTASIFLHARRGTCLVKKILEERGFDVHVHIASTFDFSTFDPMADDLVYFAGGMIGVYQAEYYPFLQKEMKIIRARLDAGKAVVGICLGAQLVAGALGAEVYLGDKGFETGWTTLELTAEGRKYPARHLCGSKTKILQWHQDTFDLPADATLLASSEQYKNQMFSYGDHGIAMQFHPEIHPEQVPEWEVTLVSFLTDENPMLSFEDFRRDTQAYVETANTHTRLFFDEWLLNLGL